MSPFQRSLMPPSLRYHRPPLHDKTVDRALTHEGLQIHVTKSTPISTYAVSLPSRVVSRWRLSSRVSVWRSLLQRLIHGDHHLLRTGQAQAVIVVQRDIAELHHPRPVAQLAHVASDTVDLGLVAASNVPRSKHPV